MLKICVFSFFSQVLSLSHQVEELEDKLAEAERAKKSLSVSLTDYFCHLLTMSFLENNVTFKFSQDNNLFGPIQVK